jgi:hypothetical protein
MIVLGQSLSVLLRAAGVPIYAQQLGLIMRSWWPIIIRDDLTGIQGTKKTSFIFKLNLVEWK